MKNRRVTLKVRPQVLRWAVDSAGWRDDELASKTGIGAGLIRQWQTCESEISLADIGKIAAKVKRPVSAFMLAEPPHEPPVAGFRLWRDSPDAPPSKPLCTAMRLAREIQYNARELLDGAPRDSAAAAGRTAARRTDDPERVAADEAALMGLPGGTGGCSPVAPTRDGRIRILYETLRDKVESRGVFVAQATFPVEEAKGFAITGKGPPVILVNAGDAVGSRIFTLLHEYAHVLLDGGSLCCPAHERLDASDSGSGKAIEGWCDSFAASILMPRREFLAELGAAKRRTLNGNLVALSQRFHMTKRAALVRAIGLLNGPDAEPYMAHYRRLGPPSSPATPTGGRSSSPVVACLNKRGWRYAKLVADMEEAGLITESDMGMYLDLKAKHFDTLRAKVWGG